METGLFTEKWVTNFRKNEWIRFKSDLNPISITFISNARARNIKTKTKTKIIIIMIYIMMMMKEYLPKERFGMFAVFNFCLG